jgi:hypothetical protein
MLSPLTLMEITYFIKNAFVEIYLLPFSINSLEHLLLNTAKRSMFMKKQHKNLTFIFGFVIVLLALLFCSKLLPEKEKPANKQSSQTNPTINLVSLNRNDMVSIHIKNEKSDFQIESTKEENGFVYKISNLETEGTLSVDSIEHLFSDLANFNAVRVAVENSENLKAYGLDSPKAQITINHPEDKPATVLKLGADAPLSNGVYVQLEGDEKVYLVASNDAKGFSSKPEDYLEKKENSEAKKESDEKVDISN